MAQENKDTPHQVPLVPLAPGNYDRAWNDPPLFSYSETTGNSYGGAKLNKRVGFPSGGPPPSSAPCDPTAPPRLFGTGSMAPPPPPSAAGIAVSAPPVAVQPAQNTKSTSIEEVDVPQICLDLKDLANKFCGEKATDILKRLEMMETAVIGSKINPRVTCLVAEFTGNLKKNQIIEADRNLTTLGADHAGDCSQWIVAMRHLLAAVREASGPQESGSGEEAKTTFFVPAGCTILNPSMD